jgi:ribose/xylose/arabinose/galactoside ABC-type transport system permease subunit
VAKGKLPAFIMTMGTLTLFRGIALLFSNGKPLYMDEELADKIYWLGNSRFFNIPLPVYIFIAVALIAWLVLEKTVFGRYIRAIGGNYEAARVAGIHVDRYKIASYVICAALAALAGILVTSRTTTGEPMLGQSYEMDAIAATVIGGTVLTGGIGTIIGTVLGAFIIGVINNILNLTNVSPYFQYVVKGLIIIVAVLIKTDKKKR